MPATRRSPARERPSPSPQRRRSGVAKSSAAAPKQAAPSKLSLVDHVLLPLLLMVTTPTFCHITAWLTAQPEPTLSTLAAAAAAGPAALAADVLASTMPDAKAAVLLTAFSGLALLIYAIPGPVKFGPISDRGARPAYADNAMWHCVLFPLVFVLGAAAGLYPLSVLYDHFGATVGLLNFGGLAFCALLYAKGLSRLGLRPSGPDAGSSGKGLLFDYYWGTELYPQLGGVDVKRFVNCRISMTYWMLAGVSFAAASHSRHGRLGASSLSEACRTLPGTFPRHGRLDPGLVLCAASQFVYLVKFFYWEIGYMRSIDIITDRAGFYETWGCLVLAPAVLTLHMRSFWGMSEASYWTGLGALHLHAPYAEHGAAAVRPLVARRRRHRRPGSHTLARRVRAPAVGVALRRDLRRRAARRRIQLRGGPAAAALPRDGRRGARVGPQADRHRGRVSRHRPEERQHARRREPAQ